MWFRKTPGLCPIYTPHEFRRLLKQECRRADRYQNRFSLAVFEVGTRDENSVLIRRLVRTIHNRFRRTDELGWYTSRQLGIILPFTPAEGAWKLAEYVSEVVAAVTSPPAFTIYTYPSDNWPKQTPLQRLAATVGWEGGTLAHTRGPDEFHALILRERARADRNGHRFSLLVFRLTGDPKRRQAERQLVRLLNERLRDTDEMGWYDARHVAAILPYVLKENAARIAENLCRNVFGVDEPIYTVYTYPESWFPPEENAAEDDKSAGPLNGDKMRAAMARQRLPLVFPDESPMAAMPAHARFLYRPIPPWKRVLDVIGSGLAILVLSPLFLLAALWIRLISAGPVFFRQERIGYMQQPFELLKFRTMPVNVDTTEHTRYVRKLIVEDSENQPMTKLERPRTLIPMGRLIRAACIDELPQLINVWRGDMSLVGPRPCLAYEAEEYLRWHTRRFDSLPGMTGLWQVKGKNRTTFKEMIRYDISYERNRSLWLDLRILLMTPWAILKQLLDRPTALPARFDTTLR
jgi:lipopolysaccharide/colanic/teichoic acid biosynthesis glycosyltransferase/GGDEF domain-containing protein